MKMIKIKKSDANVQKIVRPVAEARESLLSATSHLSLFIGRAKMISDFYEFEEVEEYIQDLENALESFNKNLSKAKAALKEAGK